MGLSRDMYYLKGNGTEENTKKAAYWFTKASEQGLVKAQKTLEALKKQGKI